METGYDILFFWVARMIMLGLEFTGEAPFRYVYLHGLVRDETGRKMSKSLGNVIDPLELIKEYGTDALRFTLLTGSTPGSDMNLSLKKVEANRNFANKIWNAGRLVTANIEQAQPIESAQAKATLADRWILARLTELTLDVNRLFDTFQYGEAGRQIYDFFWSEFADWYLEIAKLQIQEDNGLAWQTLKKMVYILDQSLRMLHPFMPFVTEELWDHLKQVCLCVSTEFAPYEGWEDALMIASWPAAEEEAEVRAGPAPSG